MEVKTDTRNELFKRNEMVLCLEADKTPSFVEVRQMIVEELGKSEENIDVYGIKSGFGNNNFKIEINVYDSKKDLDNIKKLEVTSKQRKEEANSSRRRPALSFLR